MDSIARKSESVEEETPIQVTREHRLVERAVFAGGLAGCGKSLITAVLGSFAGVEIQKYNYSLEHICSLYFLGKLDASAATAMIRMLTDMDLYNMMMSRETNFRPSDMSSIFKNPSPWRYIRRLFQRGDAGAAERIKREKPMLQSLMHQLLVLSPPIFRALGDCLRVVEVVRHPLYMIKQWHLYMHRYGTDARDFTLWFDYRGHSLPYFAHGWEEKYIASNSMDQVIYSIARLTQLGNQVIHRLSEKERQQLLVIPFERFVLDPWPYVQQLEDLLGSKRTPQTRRELKKQNVPRKMIASGIPMPIYKHYGWQPAQKGADERTELAQRRQYAAEQAAPEAMEVLDRLSAVYEEKYMRDILE